MKLPAFMSLISAAAVCGVAAAQERQLSNTEPIVSAWKAREEKARTISVVWELSPAIPKGGMSRRDNVAAVDSRYKGLVIPDHDYKHTTPCLLFIDGDKVRYESGAVKVNPERKQPLFLQRTIRAFDGRVYREINEGVEGVPPHGFYTHEPQFREAKLAGVRPFFGLFRGTTKGYTHCNPYDLLPTGRSQRIDGAECSEYLDQGHSRAATKRTVWLCPAKDWVIAHDTIDRTDGVRIATVIRYGPDPTVGWVPTGWETVEARSGEQFETSRSVVTSCVVNASIDDRHFAPTFPSGLKVTDGRTGTNGLMTDYGTFKTKDGKAEYDLAGDGSRISHYRILVFYGLLTLIGVTVVVLIVRLKPSPRRAIRLR